jgi:hypothetical protein
MRRVARYLSSACLAASVLAFIAVGALWLRSHIKTDYVYLALRDAPPVMEKNLWVYTSRVGPAINLETIEGGSRRPPQPLWRTGASSAAGQALGYRVWERHGARHLAGFWFHEEQSRYVYPDGASSGTSRYVVVPWWFLCLASGVCPAWWVLRRCKTRSARRRGACHVCGYDLRASPERCPECGTPAAK